MRAREVGYSLFGLYLTASGMFMGAEILRHLGWLSEYTLVPLVIVISWFALRVFRHPPALE
jgi:hypothetical protein